MEIGRPIRIIEIPIRENPERIYVPNWPQREKSPERIPAPNWPVRKKEPAKQE